MGVTKVKRGDVEIMEKKMETTGIFGDYIGAI